jgi:hypothetical protein
MLSQSVVEHTFPQNSSTVLQVMEGLEDMGELSTLAFWGGARYASDPVCFQWLRMHECKGFSGGYDPSAAIQQEHTILQKALSNPSLAFTMTCEGQQYTLRSQVSLLFLCGAYVMPYDALIFFLA